MSTEVRPNLFIVGAQKSGTSALSGWLGQHPQVCMSFPKEPGFLAFGEDGYPYLDGYGRPAPASRYVVRSERAYLELFTRATDRQPVIGEASTWYFSIPGTARKIQTYSPEAKIVVIFRNPIERAYSAWCHARSDRVEPCDTFSAALAMEAGRDDVEFLLRYRRMGLYSRSLAEYQAIFPASQLKVLFYDDLRADPLAVWQELCRFLNIDASIRPAFEISYNRSGKPRYPVLQGLLRSYRFKRFVRSFMPHRLAIRLKQRVDNMNLQRFPDMDMACRSELREYYRQDVQALARLTGRDLSSWLQ